MYQRHKECIAPADDSMLWRYMDLTRFIALLETSSLFFCRADLFQDAFEGSLAQANIARREELGPSDPHDEAHIEAPYRKIREWTAINCWSGIDHESAAMWSLYCPEGPGIAVRTTFGALCDAFKACEHWKIFISKVTYLDYEQAIIPDQHLLAPFLHKRRSFEHEHEVRAVIQRMLDPTMTDRPSPFEKIGGVHAKISLDALVQKIFVSPTAPTWYFDLVRKIVGRYAIPADVYQSSLAGDPIY
jgi:hypothetical protein